MTTGIQIALILNGLGLFTTIPCLLDTTPLSMTAFFVLGIPLFTAGFVSYPIVVLKDLRRHQVL